jgi:hypothetical protein
VRIAQRLVLSGGVFQECRVVSPVGRQIVSPKAERVDVAGLQPPFEALLAQTRQHQSELTEAGNTPSHDRQGPVVGPLDHRGLEQH